MPRFHIDTYDDTVCLDHEGHELADLDAACRMAYRALAEMMRDERIGRATTQFRAIVRDMHGRRLMTASLTMTVENGP